MWVTRGLIALVFLTVLGFTIIAILPHSLTTSIWTSKKYKSDATYYVSVDGSDLNPGTKERPWRTPKRAFASVRAGDTVIFKPGVYTVTTQLRPAASGYPDAPITFIGITSKDGPVVFIADNEALDSLINLSYCHYITIKDISITQKSFGSDYGDALIQIEHEAGNISLENLTIYETGKASAIWINGHDGFDRQGSPSITDISIDGGEIRDVGDGVNRESVAVSRAQRVVIKNITISDGYADLIMLNRVKNAEVDAVTLRNPLEGGEQHEDCLHIYWSYNVTVKNSIIESTTQGKTAIMVGYAENITDSEAKNIRIINSAIKSIKSVGALDVSGASKVEVIDCAIKAERHPVAISNPDAMVGRTDAAFTNNAFYGASRWLYTDSGTTSVTGSGNTFHATTDPGWPSKKRTLGNRQSSSKVE